MNYIKSAIAIAIILSTAACGWRRTPVPVVSATGSKELLVGTWAGEYSSSESGRVGSISFELEQGKDTAFCDVTMIPQVRTIRIIGNRSSEPPTVMTPPAAAPLKMRFIRLEGDRVTGSLEPYADPSCGCEVVTAFEGTFKSPNRIEGTYRTQGSGALEVSGGKWKVTRQSGVTSSKQ
jgi:hypothetical protein